MKRLLLLILSLSLAAQESLCFKESSSEKLFRDLETVAKIDKEIHDRLPLIINYNLQGGYFNMPSARTFDAGTFGIGYASLPPYNLWSLGFQFFDHFEGTGNYWVYRGVLDPDIGKDGFGDSAERSANIKFVLLRREDGFPLVPNIAIGWNDFLGTCRFNSFYVVATKEFLKWNLETTMGWGKGRIRGFYGGLGWTPFRDVKNFLNELTLVGEYDANNYRHHPFEHTKGRAIKSRINAGLQLKLWDLFRLSASSVRGDDWAASVAMNYNLGSSTGLVPKIYDRPKYTSPVDTEPLGVIRTRQEFATELAYSFQEQGFDLYNLFLIPCEKGDDDLWMKIVNVRYRQEEEVRSRIEHVLSALSPSNIKNITVVTEADGVPIQEYCFRAQDLKRYAEDKIGEDEFRIIAPPRNVSKKPNEYDSALLFKRSKRIWILTFRPWLRTFLGSNKGKFKYEVGLALNPEGYLFDQIYYNICGTYTAKSSALDINAQDTLNPSKIINVRTDSILYNQSNSFHLDQAYLQKSWNMGQGWFSRFSLGYFETAYGGLSLETLYYPVRSDWAFGLEVSSLLKRGYYGVGFQRKIRKLTDHGPAYFPYTGLQYFAEFYYHYRPLSLDFKISGGQFLARDKGIRLEGGRTFTSGLRVGLWYTITNAGDEIGNRRYYDKGFSITMPLDIFMNKSSRTRIGYSMSAWLRDCGARAATGKQLYPTLFWERYNPKPVVY